MGGYEIKLDWPYNLQCRPFITNLNVNLFISFGETTRMCTDQQALTCFVQRRHKETFSYDYQDVTMRGSVKCWLL
jgi:hypothetical protein